MLKQVTLVLIHLCLAKMSRHHLGSGHQKDNLQSGTSNKQKEYKYQLNGPIFGPKSRALAEIDLSFTSEVSEANFTK